MYLLISDEANQMSYCAVGSFKEALRLLQEYERGTLGGDFACDDKILEAAQRGCPELTFIWELLEQARRRGESVGAGLQLLRRWVESALGAARESWRWRQIVLQRWLGTLLLVVTFLTFRARAVPEPLLFPYLWEWVLGFCVLFGCWSLLLAIPCFWGNENLSQVKQWAELVLGWGDGPEDIAPESSGLREQAARAGVPFGPQGSRLAEFYLQGKRREWKGKLKAFEDRLPIIELLGLGLPVVLMVVLGAGLFSAFD